MIDTEKLENAITDIKTFCHHLDVTTWNDDPKYTFVSNDLIKWLLELQRSRAELDALRAENADLQRKQRELVCSRERKDTRIRELETKLAFYTPQNLGGIMIGFGAVGLAEALKSALDRCGIESISGGYIGYRDGQFIMDGNHIKGKGANK